ncbi:MAG: hypothetical protein V1827_05880 [Candidatus Micrarchaeota archaeon]
MSQLQSQKPQAVSGKNGFANGRREILLSVPFQEFHRVLVRDVPAAVEMMKSSPENVHYAAVELSSVDIEVCHDAARALKMAIKAGVKVSPVLGEVAMRMLVDEVESMRTDEFNLLKLAREHGQDMSPAADVFGSMALPRMSAEVRSFIESLKG